MTSRQMNLLLERLKMPERVVPYGLTGDELFAALNKIIDRIEALERATFNTFNKDT